MRKILSGLFAWALVSMLTGCGEQPVREYSMLDRWAEKEVFASRLVDDMETVGGWTVLEGNPRIGYTGENVHDGKQALRARFSLVDSTYILAPEHRTPWGSFGAKQGGWNGFALEFDEPQDWSGYNRIALWAYIHPSKNQSVSFALSLVNGTQPDSILSPARETNLDIPQGRWVQVLWEIDYFRRDSIRRFEISQTPTGFDRSIGEQYVTIDFDGLELQKVEPDHYEGWDIPEGEIAFSHAGYRPADSKIALAAASEADSFVLKNEKGRTVFTGTPSLLTSRDIPFARLDFSDWTKPGTYTIQYGGAVSEPFRIGEDIWNRPLQAALNFYRNQRCGDEVPGVHGVCHADVMGFYGEEKKPVNGGWHDAGDLSQGTWRTAYGCYALLTALETKALDAEALRGEIAWGVDWLLKTRFADGRHMAWSQCRIYTDGEAGTFDDIVRPAEYVPWELFLTSAVFSRASALLDPSRKAELEKAAVEDWEAAMKASGWAEASYLEASWGAVSSALLYECSREERFKETALCFGDLLLRCQERDFVDGIPYAGYFYTDTCRKALRHYNHEAFCEAPMLAFSALCRVFPDQSAPWREAARLYLDAYLKPGSRISAPFDLLPAGIYRRADMRKPTDLQQYEAGTQLGDAYAIRTFPIWKDHVFHGSTNFHLSQAWALASAAALLQDRDAMGLVQEQLEWTLGRNPFSSSLMYGVGYNYAPGFVYCTHNIVGALPVGIDCFQGDAPFWNGTAHATSHEIWIEPVSRFVGTLATFLQDMPAEVNLHEANPFVGTGGDGHTYPGATAPFGMVQLSPDTHNRGWEAASGYRDKDSTLIGFSHTHLSGTGGVDLGDFLFTPFREAVPFSKEDEVAYPGYYSVQTQGIKAELTALPRTGCQRYTFQGEGERKLWVDLRYNIGGTHPDRITFDVISDRVIEGGRHVVGWAQDRWMFFSAAFSVPFTSCEADGEDRYLLTFPSGTKELTVTVGLSPTDALAARRNRLAEASDGDFDRIRKTSESLWKGQLSKIAVEGGTSTQRTNFYSALYHTLIAPNLLSDVGERPFYSTLSLWDTFRSWNPLMVLLNPEMIGDQAESLVRMYGRDGKLPLWALGGVDVDCMIGYHSVSVIADAWLRGIRTFDGEKALAAMVASSNLDPASEWYNTYGYIPSDYTPESVSKTLEFCYDDWCIARMAESLGHKDLAAEYDARSLRYRNLFDPSTGFFRGKESDGNWRVPFDPVSGSRDYTEAIAWQYRHFVPHDMRGYTDLMGGPEAVRASLDSLFETTSGQLHDGNITGLVGLYAHGNEPSHGTAWLYSYVERPSESQRRVRQMLDDMYRPAPDGICGNEDCGQMSAWYVLSALGLYPVCPGSGEFVLGAPLFGKATVSLPNGRRLVITADHPEHPYVKEVCLNGKQVDRQYVTYEEIMRGGELSFRLSGKPCSDRDALPAPYSLSEEPLVSTPYLTGNPRFFDGSFPVELLCRTPDARIHYTLDGSEPTEASALYEGPFSVTEDCVLKARAFKPGCTPSPQLRSHMFPIEYVPAVTVTGLQPGCRYTYHRGMFLRVAQVAVSPVVRRGVLPAPSIEGATDEDHFGFIFEGYLDVPEEGLWEFAVTSDDGAVLEIDGHLAVNGDGSHANYTATGHIALRKGLHAFRLLYLEDYEGQNLEWAWKSPGSDTFDPIPRTESVFRKRLIER